MWRVLRKPSALFVDQDDPNAMLIYNGDDLKYMVDVSLLTNGTRYYYCVFYYDGTTWTRSAVVSATPNSTYTDDSVDVMGLVRDRLDYGLQNEITIGALTPATGHISVLNAPPVYEETNWPVVTVHMGNDADGERAIGENIFPDEFDPSTGLWNENQGWISRTQLTIVGWSLNPDERIQLRKSLQKIIIGNLQVFDNAGIFQIGFSQQDVDDLTGYNAPVYQSACVFSCQAPAGVGNSEDSIVDVTLSMTTP